ncbi:MAG TPA: hypothetical protein VFR93_03810, partial [Candidatus Limnocylindrales bacterium]|nr:hypothetical protein [Candidatus Limnocylindrales bacterium]
GGFSCREQIEGATTRTVVHPAELIALAIRRSPDRAARLPDAPSASQHGPGDPIRRSTASTGVSS